MKATQAEDRLRRTDAFMCANDTATLSSGVTTQETSRQAQRAADVIAAWAFQWKMRVAALARTHRLLFCPSGLATRPAWASWWRRTPTFVP